jgi:hypothetical protein
MCHASGHLRRENLILAMNGEKSIAQVNPEVPVKKVVRFMKYVWILLIGLALVTGCNRHPVSSAWTPPQNPDPQKILTEADEDTGARQYTNALAKYVWFYQNALKYDPAMRGVRVSFALSSWERLGEVYPPALDKLKAVRDEAEAKVRQGNDVEAAFEDFVAINGTLKDDDRTSQFFAWLDANRPELAKEAFDRTQNWLLPALIEVKQYQLCSKYIDPKSSFDEILRLYRTTTKHATESKDSSLKNFEDKYFINRTTMLIAVLTVTDRKGDAQQIVDRISKEQGLPEFKTEIEKALNGEVPPPWP